MKYRDLFSIALLHQYFGTPAPLGAEIDQYLDLKATPECLQRIKQYRLILRKKPGKWYLTSPSPDGTKIFLPEEEVTFRFFLQIKDPNFFHLTDFTGFPLGNIFKGIQLPRFWNSGATEQLSFDLFEYEASDTFFIRKERASDDSFYLQSQTIPGLTEADFTISGLSGTVQNITYHPVLQKISFDTRPSQYADNQPFHVKYRAIPSWASTTFGLLDIKVDGANVAFDQTYKVTFANKSALWQYLIIGDDELTTADLAIENGMAGGTGSLSFESASEVTSGAEFQKLKVAFPDAKFFSIASSAAVPYQKKKKAGIKLKKEGNVIIQDLPNPSPYKQGIEIINIHL